MGKAIGCWASLALLPLSASAAVEPHDGQHDFDFNVGGWNTHIRRLQNPLSGSNEWTEMNGTVVVKSI